MSKRTKRGKKYQMKKQNTEKVYDVGRSYTALFCSVVTNVHCSMMSILTDRILTKLKGIGNGNLMTM